jgi:hypothetical protein
MSSQNESRRSPLSMTAWMLTGALLIVRLLPAAAQPGMFFDGVTYATIAKNMSVGVGDLWHPVLFGPASDYYESPTLPFWFQSQLFRVFGDHFWVEKLYSAMLGIATAALIAATWRWLLRDRPRLRDCSWLPVVLWLILPSWAWMYDSNMLENSLGLFAIASVYASLRAADSPRGWIAWVGLAATCLMGAVLSKGPVGMFPLVTPAVIAITIRRGQLRHMLVIQEGLALAFMLLLGLVLVQPGAHNYLTTYFHQQVVSSLAGHREIVHSRFGRLDILFRMAGQLIVPGLVAAVLFYLARSRRGRTSAAAPIAEPNLAAREMLFCLFTAASASLPIAISPKQSGHYAFPSYALYALALAIWCVPAVLKLFGSPNSAPPAPVGEVSVAPLAKGHQWLRGLAGAAVACVLIATCFLAGRPHRDKDVYYDTLAIGRLVPRQSVIGFTSNLDDDYPIRLYLARWDGIATDFNVGNKASGGIAASTALPEFCLASLDAAPPAGYTLVPADLIRYRLFERKVAASVGLSTMRVRQ